MSLYSLFIHLDEVECLGEHDDTTGSLLPDHPPEVIHRGLRRPLSDNVSVRLK